jgi:hypothetical protein
LVAAWPDAPARGYLETLENVWLWLKKRSETHRVKDNVFIGPI